MIAQPSKPAVMYGEHPAIGAGSPCDACGQARRLVTDHCHVHGWVRGAVCFGCNGRLASIDERIRPRADAPLLEALLAVWRRCPECGHLAVSDLTAPRKKRSRAIRRTSSRRRLFVRVTDDVYDWVSMQAEATGMSQGGAAAKILEEAWNQGWTINPAAPSST